MLEEEAFSGSPTKPPFYFQHFNLNRLNVLRSGTPLNKNYEPNWTTGDYVKEFRALYDTLGIGINAQVDIGGLTLSKFAHGGANYYAFNLCPDMCSLYHTHQESWGDIDLELGFSQPTSSVIKVMVFLIYNGGIKINSLLEVTKAVD